MRLTTGLKNKLSMFVLMDSIKEILRLQIGDLLVTKAPITAIDIGTNRQPTINAGTQLILLNICVIDYDFYFGPVWKFAFIANQRLFEREFVDSVFVKSISLMNAFKATENKIHE